MVRKSTRYWKDLAAKAIRQGDKARAMVFLKRAELAKKEKVT